MVKNNCDIEIFKFYRARKSAAEDELNTVKGTVETFHNSSKALSNEIEQLNETVKLLNKNLDEETAKSTHLENLVAAMESQPDVEARSKVEISDLKNELATAQVESGMGLISTYIYWSIIGKLVRTYS